MVDPKKLHSIVDISPILVTGYVELMKTLIIIVIIVKIFVYYG